MLEPKELAKLGYIKFDLNTGLAGNGKTLCLISDDEKRLLEDIREVTANRPGLHALDGTIEYRGSVTEISANINVLARPQI
jgi:hypothetical protein